MLRFPTHRGAQIMEIARRETLAAMAASLAAMVPVRANALLNDADAIDLSFVNPELRPAVATIRASFGGNTHLTVDGIEQLRGASPAEIDPPFAHIPVVRRSIPGLAGNPPVTIYVVNARPGRKRGGILYMHGGGYVLGRAIEDIGTCQALAEALDSTVVSVDYRLAPAARYTASIEDNYTALRWVYQNAGDIGMDPRRIAVMGESAGGGHAALLAITARDRREVPVAFQCLVYPMLDDRTGSTRPVPPPIGSLVWTAEVNRFGWRSLLGREPGHPTLTAGVPAREAILAGLPPAWVGVGSIDLFVQEDMAYAERLIAAAVPTELVVVPGAYHAFQYFAPDAPLAKCFRASMLAALQAALV